jgi:hypothetical protein
MSENVSVWAEESGRYLEIYINGVPDGSIAYDKAEGELIVDGQARARENGVVVELPESPLTFENEDT